MELFTAQVWHEDGTLHEVPNISKNHAIGICRGNWIMSGRMSRAWCQDRDFTICFDKYGERSGPYAETTLVTPGSVADKLPATPYGPMCRDPNLCAGKGYCPRDPTCGD